LPDLLTRACTTYGCAHASPCPVHGREAKRHAYDDRRGSASSRGYGSRWRKFTEWYRHELQRHGIQPLCGARIPGAPQTTDSDCQSQGLITIGRIVDHIVPVQSATDANFYNPMGMQLLCDGVTGRGCHDRKRQRERHHAR
jgi:hypothetical protein